MFSEPPFRQVVAIVQDCLRAYQNVTDAKDAALRAFARRRLEVDTATVNRAMNAALSADRYAQTVDAIRTSTRIPRVDWSRVRQNLIDHGLLPKG